MPLVPVPSVPAEHRRPQPLHLNLENQRKQARSLLNAARAGDPRALRRFAAMLPERSDSTAAAAADPQRWSLRHASYGRWRYGYTPRTVPDRGIPRNYLAVARRTADKGTAR